jgi:hypothetical protein
MPLDSSRSAGTALMIRPAQSLFLLAVGVSLPMVAAVPFKTDTPVLILFLLLTLSNCPDIRKRLLLAASSLRFVNFWRCPAAEMLFFTFPAASGEVTGLQY